MYAIRSHYELEVAEIADGTIEIKGIAREPGQRTTVREYATLNRGTADSGTTVVGDDCLIMAYAHVSHDSRVGNHVIIANCVGMGRITSYNVCYTKLLRAAP